MSAWQNESLSASPSLPGAARGDSLIGAMDGQAETDSLERQAGRQEHELLLERLPWRRGVPLIAPTTVAGRHSVSSPQEGWDGRSPSLGEKGHLPLNTLNKMNRKRGEESAERGREGACVKRRGDRFFRRPVRHPRRPLAVGRHSQNVLSVREMGNDTECLALTEAGNERNGRQRDRDRKTSERKGSNDGHGIVAAS